jgi:hypothetical protein
VKTSAVALDGTHGVSNPLGFPTRRTSSGARVATVASSGFFFFLNIVITRLTGVVQGQDGEL